MVKKISLLAGVFSLLISIQAKAGSWSHDLQVKARVGWSVGATAPIGLPETIRGIDAYRLTPSLLVGADLQLPLAGKWGLLTGLHFENKAMDADVTTKAYHLVVRKGDSQLEGLFSGKVHQEVTEWMFTLPIQATYAFNSRLQLKAGPYCSLLTRSDFSGIASDGYLRQGSPTGPKILMGDKEGEWATYDFSDDLRHFQIGLCAGLDWQFYQNVGASVDFSWGLNGIFKSNFDTIEQTLFPLYGTISLFYRLK